jgi:hypothetical protein
MLLAFIFYDNSLVARVAYENRKLFLITLSWCFRNVREVDSLEFGLRQLMKSKKLVQISEANHVE